MTLRRLPPLFVTCLLGYASPVFAQTRVACVGDSITEGYGLNSPQQDAYPAQLQGLLGADYEVENFGVSATTARKQGDKPYWEENAYTTSTSFQPNIVLLMLGTNDAKPANWNEAAFRTDYVALITHYAQPGARVFVATPPKVFGNGAFDISPTTVNDTLVPLVRELAIETDTTLVDIFVATQDHGAWFPDNIHPSREGAQLLAETFAAAVNAEAATDATSDAPPIATGSAPTATSSDPGTELESSAATNEPSNSSATTSSSSQTTAPITSVTPDGSSVSPNTTASASTNSSPVAPASSVATEPTGPTSGTSSTTSGSNTSATATTTAPTSAPHRHSSCSAALPVESAGHHWQLAFAALCALGIRSARRLPRR